MDVLKQLEKQIVSADKLQADGAPSASIAILRDGKITSHVITNGKENTDTVYQACSISKAFTGLAVARLIDQKRISYDTKVVDHLSQTAIDCVIDSKTAHLIEHVTVGMLLSHTSGLSQGGFVGYPDDPPNAETILAGKYPSNTPKVRFLTFPGAQYSYAGGGFIVLQLVLESITGLSFEDLMQELVLKPLDMTRSRYGDLPPDEKNYAISHDTGYTPCKAEHHHLPEKAAAGLWTTPTDMLKAVVAVQDSLYADGGFLTTETAQSMLKELPPDVRKTVANADQLLKGRCQGGWAVNDHAFSHDGQNSPGYTSNLTGFHGGTVNCESPSETNKSLGRSGIAIMVNCIIGYQVAIPQIRSAVFSLLDWPRFSSLSDRFVKDDQFVPYAASEDATVDSDWKGWEGQWDDWRISEQDGHPSISFKNFSPMRLRTAAAPVAEMQGAKRELFFVVDGLSVGVRLTWEDDERIVELIQKRPSTLRRK